MDNQNYQLGQVRQGAGTAGLGYGGGNSVNAVDAPPTDSKIRDGISYLETQLNDLHSVISTLETRLDTVLAPVPPSVSATQSKETSGPPVSHVFSRLSSLSNVVSEAHSRLRSILSRIEV